MPGQFTWFAIRASFTSASHITCGRKQRMSQQIGNLLVRITTHYTEYYAAHVVLIMAVQTYTLLRK